MIQLLVAPVPDPGGHRRRWSTSSSGMILLHHRSPLSVSVDDVAAGTVPGQRWRQPPRLRQPGVIRTTGSWSARSPRPHRARRHRHVLGHATPSHVSSRRDVPPRWDAEREPDALPTRQTRARRPGQRAPSARLLSPMALAAGLSPIHKVSPEPFQPVALRHARLRPGRLRLVRLCGSGPRWGCSSGARCPPWRSRWSASSWRGSCVSYWIRPHFMTPGDRSRSGIDPKSAPRLQREVLGGSLHFMAGPPDIPNAFRSSRTAS